MNNTAKNELKKIALKKIDRAELSIRKYNEKVVEGAKGYALEVSGGNGLQLRINNKLKEIEILCKKAEDIGFSTNKIGTIDVKVCGGGYYNSTLPKEGTIARKLYDSYIEDYRKEIDFDDLRERVITSIYLADDADAVNKIMDMIDGVSVDLPL